jgi:hypothetical protein
MILFRSRDFHALSATTTRVSMVLFSLLLILAAVFLSVGDAEAASKRGYEAMQVSLPKTGFTMEPGATQQVMIEFQNIGEKTWVNEGTAYVSIYTYSPKYRASDFTADDWVDYTQAALLHEDSVAVGGVGHIYLTLTAPKSQGQYQETFQLAAENRAWIPGGEFTLTINVSDGTTAVATQDPATSAESVNSVDDGTASPETDGLSAMILLRSAKTVTAEAGEEVSYKVGVKNTGTVNWETRELRTNELTIASVSTTHASWVSSDKLVVNDSGLVKPGGLDFLEFTFTAPSTKGTHNVRYTMAVDDVVIPDFYIDIPVEVTSGAAAAIDEPLTVDEGTVQADRIIDEPIMRIGLLTIDEETDWVTEISCNTTWKLIDEEGGLLGSMAKDEMVRAFYKNQRYYFNRGKGIEQTHKYLRFVPDSDDGICTIENFDRRVSRNAAYADNTFRDVLELQYIPYKDEVWVINELPVEEYLYGLAETSNYSHNEFKKTLITVARTYGLYHFERNTKHHGYFHMNAYADDQVYKGYEYEQRHYLIKGAVDSTRGVTVNYNGRTAITPYFSRSDGRTRSWSEVWGGVVEWVISVPAPHDAAAGRTLWGHGVGMSATEALDMAEEGSTWEDILHYFYTGIELNQRWE